VELGGPKTLLLLLLLAPIAWKKKSREQVCQRGAVLKSCFIVVVRRCVVQMSVGVVWLQVFALPIFCTCVLFALQCMARRGGGLPGVWSLQGGPQDAAATAGTVHNEEEIKLAGMHLQSWCDVAVFLFVIADRLWQCCWPWWYYSVWCGATDVVMRRCPSNSQVTVSQSVRQRR
jgi:hypothetical protein